jgi:CheY-like chemotaxis protein
MTPDARSLRVAVLDDDEDVVASIAAVLRSQGLHVEEFSSTKAFLAAKDRESYDAYVVDWLLGDVTALGVVASLRSHEASRAVPIILLSGNIALAGVPTDPVLAATIEQYRLLYRAKPYSTLQLARDICSACEGDPP